MSNSFFNFSSNYKYIFDTYRQRALQMELALTNGDFLESELDTIGDEMVEVAREFARVQGVFRKGNLINSITKEYGGPGKIILRAPVRDKRGKFYAGHQEYGFHPRGGKTFIPARPFMRPALSTVAAKSRRGLTKHLMDLWAGESAFLGGVNGSPVGLTLGHSISTTQGNVIKNIHKSGIGNSTSGRSGSFRKQFSASTKGHSFSNTNYVRRTMGWTR